MKTKQHTKRWLGLALACGALTFTLTTQAGKPIKPPTEPPPSAAYDLVLLEPGSYANDVNESGLVLGRTSPPGGDDYLSLVVPQQDNGVTIWHKDDNLDGRNDLLVDLGIPAWGGLNLDAGDINDHGVILGGGVCEVPGTQYYSKVGWILSPQMIDGQLTWALLDDERVNGLITPLHAADDPYRYPVIMEVMPTCINNHGEVSLVIEDAWQRGFLLLPNRYEVSPEGAVTVEYPAEDLDGDGFNDALIDLGMGVRVSDGAKRPLLPTVINDRGDVAGMVWGRALGDVCGDRPFVLRPRLDENLGLVWNEDNDGDGLNDLVIYLPLPAEVIDAASSYTGATWISDMNEAGTIVGTVHYAAPKGSRAAIWQVDWETGTVTYAELGALGRYKISSANGVNATGQVIGRSIRYLPDGVDTKAWLWDANGVVLLSDLVPAETGLADGSSNITGINDGGMIVGSQQSDYSGPSTSFIAVPVDEP